MNSTASTTKTSPTWVAVLAGLGFLAISALALDVYFNKTFVGDVFADFFSIYTVIIVGIAFVLSRLDGSRTLRVCALTGIICAVIAIIEGTGQGQLFKDRLTKSQQKDMISTFMRMARSNINMSISEQPNLDRFPARTEKALREIEGRVNELVIAQKSLYKIVTSPEWQNVMSAKTLANANGKTPSILNQALSAAKVYEQAAGKYYQEWNLADSFGIQDRITVSFLNGIDKGKNKTKSTISSYSQLQVAMIEQILKLHRVAHLYSAHYDSSDDSLYFMDDKGVEAFNEEAKKLDAMIQTEAVIRKRIEESNKRTISIFESEFSKY